MVNLESVMVTFSARVVVFFSFNHRTTLLHQLHSNPHRHGVIQPLCLHRLTVAFAGYPEM